ncbi:hypothetical protein GC194_10260 [bacterium]|nr:hypothetical protein [bacterium]
MKRRLQFLVLIALLAGGYTTQAQVVITKATYPFGVGIDSFSYVSNASSLSLPEKGADKTYDYSNANWVGYELAVYNDASASTEFPSATEKMNTYYSVQGMIYRAKDYYRTDDKGYAFVGRTQFDTAYSLLKTTGNANDEFHFPTSSNKTEPNRYQMKFPFTYEDSWQEMDIQIVDYDITIAAFGLNKVPGTIVRRRYQTRKVVGYGKLILPDGNGGKAPAINALLVTTKDSIIDSVFLAGKPAPAALLAAFKYQQGYTWIYKTVVFEMQNLGRQPLGFVLNTDGSINHGYIRPRATRVPTGLEKINEQISQWQLYPNNLKSGEVLTINSSEKITELHITGVDGKSYILRSNGDNKFTIPNLSSGLYVVNYTSKQTGKIFRDKVLISQ